MPDINGGVTLEGNNDDNRIDGTAANDILGGNGGDDTIYGNAGNDFIYGGTGMTGWKAELATIPIFGI